MARDGGRGRGDKWARRASRNTDPYAEGSGAGSEPVDIVAVRRDDELINAIARGGPIPTESTEELQLATLLADWRAEIVAPPLPDAPDLDTVVAAVNQEIGARQARIGAQSGGRLRLLRPIATTAAALALVFGGLSAFSYQAEPGDALWRVKEVVFSEQAQSTVVQYADDNLAAAQTLLEQGKPEQARARLEQASANATQINDPVKRNELVDRWNQLFEVVRKVAPDIAAQLEQSVPAPDPAAPIEPSIPGGTAPGGSTERPGSTVTTTPGGGSQLPMELPGSPGGSPGGDRPVAPDTGAPERPGPAPDAGKPDVSAPDTPAPETSVPGGDGSADTTAPNVPGPTTPDGPGADTVDPPTMAPSTVSSPGPVEPPAPQLPQTGVPSIPQAPQILPSTVPGVTPN